jgi:hypothetical protein
MSAKFDGKIFFYCYPSLAVSEAERFQHLLICLGEGLRKLEIPFYSNVNYWQESPEKEQYLFHHDPKITPDDCSIVVLQHNWFTLGTPLPENLFHSKRKYVTVYLDGNDSDQAYPRNSDFRRFDFIFRNHYNSKLKYEKNFYPWSFGLSNRILREADRAPRFQEKKRHLLINFRNWKAGHPVRSISCRELIPHIQNILPIDNYVDSLNSHPVDAYHYLQWIQTGGRHYPNYYKRLKDSAACACFGGFFVAPWSHNPGSLVSRGLKRVVSKLSLKSNTIVQWDSWRFWESLASGCATFHVDFEKYGLTLPVMPENWRHYIGIDLDNVQEAVNRIANDPAILERIATEGRLWALEHYSPVPTTLRFLKTISQTL